jgi:hypothetical protein
MAYQTEENSIPSIQRIIIKISMTFEMLNSLRLQGKCAGVSLLFHLEAKTCTVPVTLRCFGNGNKVQRKNRVGVRFFFIFWITIQNTKDLPESESARERLVTYTRFAGSLEPTRSA